MAGDITGIDHLLIAVDDLEAAHETYVRLGFTSTPRGRHPQWGTGNYCFMFANDYMEIIGVVDPDEFAANAARRGKRREGEGLSAIALATDDAQAAKDNLAEAGIETDGPKDLSRLLEGDGGPSSEPRFYLLHLAPAATPGMAMFLCNHLTPDLVRRDGWTEHHNGVIGIKNVAVPVDDALSLEDAYKNLLGHGAVTTTDNIMALRVGSASVVFASRNDLDTIYPDLLPEPDEGPCPAIISLRVADINATAKVLAAAGVPLLSDLRSVMVAAEDACGVALVFTT